MKQSGMSLETKMDSAPHLRRSAFRRDAAFGLLLIAVIAAFWGPLSSLAYLSIHSDEYSHVVLIPFVTALLLFWKRKPLRVIARYGVAGGLAMIVCGAILRLLGTGRELGWGPETRLGIAILSALLILWGGFILCYGARSFRNALFPLLFLLFIVPLPNAFSSRFIHLLQEGSADAAFFFFKITGTPVYRENFRFLLSGVAIEVAEECSGIHSTLALLITAVLAGQYFLRSRWRRIVLCLLVIPISVVKNGMRIFMLSTLAAYVDPAFLHGKLHRFGGIPFFALGLLFLYFVLRVLQATENFRRVSTTGLLGSPQQDCSAQALKEDS